MNVVCAIEWSYYRPTVWILSPLVDMCVVSEIDTLAALEMK